MLFPTYTNFISIFLLLLFTKKNKEKFSGLNKFVIVINKNNENNKIKNLKNKQIYNLNYKKK